MRENGTFSGGNITLISLSDGSTPQNLNLSLHLQVTPILFPSSFQHFTPDTTFPIKNNLLTLISSTQELAIKIFGIPNFFSSCQQLGLPTLPFLFCFLLFICIFSALLACWELFHFILASSFCYSSTIQGKKLTLSLLISVDRTVT